MLDIKEELKKLPSSPGVYMMHGEQDEIIYVGKAVSLKNRVRQYFRDSDAKTAKIQKMVSHISRFEYIVTDSEMEALILECNLIKEYNPKYNTMLKDDKSYPFIRVTVEEEYPRILFSRRRGKDKSRYFGPYPSAGAVKETIDLLRKLYKIRSCGRDLPRDIGKARPCLNYQMKQCEAPCQGNVSPGKYREEVKKAMDFLSGSDQTLLRELEQKMSLASEKLEFEKAIEYRNLLESVRRVHEKQKITGSDDSERDIVGFARSQEEAVVQIFFIRSGKMVGREHFYLRVPEDEEEDAMLASFLKQYYGGTPFIPKELLMPVRLKESDEKEIEGWLTAIRGSRVRIKYPVKGEKERFVELAGKNADMILNKDKEKIRLEEARTKGAVKQVEEALGLYGIHRMEAYDISHIGGSQTVGSMVVFEDGKPRKHDYRKFRLRTVAGPDDYASMKEVLLRRFLRGLEEEKLRSETDENMTERSGTLENENEPERPGTLENENVSQDADAPGHRTQDARRFLRFPDLICMDGGKGQVNIALEVLQSLHLDIPVCGMVKDDNHRTRGIYYNNQEISMKDKPEGFAMITRLQDEAHRFAITYHRNLRGKQQVRSILDDIPGVGEKRRRALMRHFENIEAIQNAGEEELARIEGMNRKSAGQVYDFFHKSR